jgi:hypothetical protein
MALPWVTVTPRGALVDPDALERFHPHGFCRVDHLAERSKPDPLQVGIAQYVCATVWRVDEAVMGGLANIWIPIG